MPRHRPHLSLVPAMLGLAALAATAVAIATPPSHAPPIHGLRGAAPPLGGTDTPARIVQGRVVFEGSSEELKAKPELLHQHLGI